MPSSDDLRTFFKGYKCAYFGNTTINQYIKHNKNLRKCFFITQSLFRKKNSVCVQHCQLALAVVFLPTHHIKTHPRKDVPTARLPGLNTALAVVIGILFLLNF